MRFETAHEGFIFQSKPNTVAGGSRCALADNGEVVCTFVVQKELGGGKCIPLLFRSKDGGVNWEEQGQIWPRLQNEYSIFGSVSRAPDGALFFFGARTKIADQDGPGWCEETQGLRQNELMWAKSIDNGMTWTAPVPIPMPIPGSAEAAGAMCITRNGAWLCCYSPYNTFDPALVVDRNQVVFLRSDDEGRTWTHTSMLRFDNENDGAAEAWVIELADGRLLGASWHLDLSDSSDYHNAYSLSSDGGRMWLPTRATGIMGQSAALAPLSDGRALFIYNQRKHAQAGVWLAVARPDEDGFGVEANQIVWKAETKTQSGTSGDLTDWTDFSFGEPSIMVLPDETLLATLWCIQPSGRGIYSVKLKMHNNGG